ncbi:hypothetical protein AeMF1_019517, partial [Aphanomyces euteiches]
VLVQLKHLDGIEASQRFKDLRTDFVTDLAGCSQGFILRSRDKIPSRINPIDEVESVWWREFKCSPFVLHHFASLHPRNVRRLAYPSEPWWNFFEDDIQFLRQGTNLRSKMSTEIIPKEKHKFAWLATAMSEMDCQKFLMDVALGALRSPSTPGIQIHSASADVLGQQTVDKADFSTKNSGRSLS